MSELSTSLRLGWHVVVRNWTVYKKDFVANISPTLADPALLLTSLGMGLSPFIGGINGLTYAAFFDSSYGFYVRMTFESIFKAMLTTPIGVREVVIGEFLWSAIRAGMMGASVGLVLAVMGLLPNPWAILAFPLIAGTLAIPCAAIGLLAAGFVRNMNQFQTVYSFLIAPIFYLSAVFFPLDNRPILGTVVNISPFYHGVRLAQMTAWGRWDFSSFAFHISALLAFSVGLGLWASRRIRRKLIS